jgi:hypothetical protein
MDRSGRNEELLGEEYDVRDDLLLALGDLAPRFTKRQEEIVESYFDSDDGGFADLVDWARLHADDPVAMIVSECNRRVELAAKLAALQSAAGEQASEKRVKSILNYARSCLAEMPDGDREADVRHAYKGISDNMVREALLLASSVAKQPPSAEQVKYEKALLVHAYRRQVEQLGEAEAEKWLRLCHPGYAEALLKALAAPA